MAAGDTLFNRRMSVGQSACVVQFTSADYRSGDTRLLRPGDVLCRDSGGAGDQAGDGPECRLRHPGQAGGRVDAGAGALGGAERAGGRPQCGRLAVGNPCSLGITGKRSGAAAVPAACPACLMAPGAERQISRRIGGRGSGRCRPLTPAVVPGWRPGCRRTSRRRSGRHGSIPCVYLWSFPFCVSRPAGAADTRTRELPDEAGATSVVAYHLDLPGLCPLAVSWLTPALPVCTIRPRAGMPGKLVCPRTARRHS